MENILLQIVADSTRITNTKISSGHITTNVWFWIAVAEFLIILLLFIAKTRKQKIIFDSSIEQTLNESKSASVDMNNLMNSINKSRDLYKQLSTKCHPDRFTDVEQNKKANYLFQEITKHQRNYNRLLELKESAQKDLNITI